MIWTCALKEGQIEATISLLLRVRRIRIYHKAYAKFFYNKDDLKFRGYNEIHDGCGAKMVKSLPHKITASFNGGREESKVVELR